jgi:hypothetical protein
MTVLINASNSSGLTFTSDTSGNVTFQTSGANVFSFDTTLKTTFANSATATAFIPSGSTVPANGMYLAAANTVAFSTSSVESTRINSAGSLLLNYSGATTTTDPQGIGLASPVNTLLQYYLIKQTQVEAHFGFKSGADSNLYVGTAGGTTGVGSYGLYQTNTGNSWNAVSDETLKTDLKPILDALNKVSSLRAVTGRYTYDSEDKSRSFLIAQDVQKVLPEAVSIADHETGTLGLGYTDVIPLLVAAIKELKAEIDLLKAGK